VKGSGFDTRKTEYLWKGAWVYEKVTVVRYAWSYAARRSGQRAMLRAREMLHPCQGDYPCMLSRARGLQTRGLQTSSLRPRMLQAGGLRPRVLQAGGLRPRVLQAGEGGYSRMLPETGMLCAQVLRRGLACGLVQVAIVEP